MSKSKLENSISVCTNKVQSDLIEGVLNFCCLQLGQLSVIPPGLVLEVGGDFNLAGSYACKVEVPPHFKVPSGGDFSSPGMAAC